MRSFEEILEIAAERKGGRAAVLGAVDPPLSADDLAEIPDDRWLSRMTRAVFQAGFSWKVIEAKWPGFEEAFRGFDVGACAMMSDDWFDELLKDTRIVPETARRSGRCRRMRFSCRRSHRRPGASGGRSGTGRVRITRDY